MRLFIFIFLVTYCKLSFSQGDCGTSVCASTSVSSYTAGASSIAELSASNRGCLSSNEASSSFWMRFCFNTAGSFQFTVDPSGNRNDFDFAIWNTQTCPPTSAPTRCSYSSVPNGGACTTCDWIGLSSTSTVTTEGAAGTGMLAPITVTAGQCLIMNVNNFGSGSSAFTIAYGALSPPVSICPIVLPIELLYFNGKEGPTYNLLNWASITESNNDYYSLERSTDALNWDIIAKIDGAGNSVEKKNYQFKDPKFKEGINYYRLSQTDFDGNTEFFKIIDLTNTLVHKVIVRVVNMMGQDVPLNCEELRVIYYSDGTIVKQVGEL